MPGYADWVSLERQEADEAEYPRFEGAHEWKRTEAGIVDFFAGVDYDFHNGPLCLRCGESFCEHCDPQKKREQCPKYGTELPGMDTYE